MYIFIYTYIFWGKFDVLCHLSYYLIQFYTILYNFIQFTYTTQILYYLYIKDYNSYTNISIREALSVHPSALPSYHKKAMAVIQPKIHDFKEIHLKSTKINAIEPRTSPRSREHLRKRLRPPASAPLVRQRFVDENRWKSTRSSNEGASLASLFGPEMSIFPVCIYLYIYIYIQ